MDLKEELAGISSQFFFNSLGVTIPTGMLGELATFSFLFPRPKCQITLCNHARLQLAGGGNHRDAGAAILTKEGKHNVIIVRGPDGCRMVILVEIGQDSGELVCGWESVQFFAFTGVDIQHL